MKRKKHQSSSI